MKSCPYQKTDNKGYTNCTKNDSTIGCCQTPCPYRKPLHQLQAKHRYIGGYGRNEAFSVKEACFKLCCCVFAYTYVCIEAEEGSVYAC